MRLLVGLLAVAVLVVPPASAGAAKLTPAAPKVVGERVVEPGGTVRVLDHVRNKGRSRSRTTRTRFLLSLDVRPSRHDVRLGTRRIPPLGHVQASRRTITLEVPARTARGLWRLIACVGRRCRTSSLPLRVGRPAPPGPAAAAAPEHDPSREVAGGNGLRSVRDCGMQTAAPDAPAAAFTAMFAGAREGWTGGDSTYSVRLPGGRIAWLFGDTYVGRVTPEGGRRVPWYQARNSAVVQDDCLTTFFHGSYAYPRSFQPADGDPETEWYWPNEPVVHGDRIRAFWTRFVPAAGGYEAAGAALATYDLDMRLQRVRTVPTGAPREWWGSAIVDAGPHTYVFGLRHTSTTEVLLARTPIGDLDGRWEYRTAGGWGASPADAVPVHQHTAAQFSVVRDARGWALVSQIPGQRGVNAWRAADPWGPYPGAGTRVVDLPDVPGAREYNALVHDELTSGGQALVSYNVMPDSESLLLGDASLYRPRFVRAALP